MGTLYDLLGALPDDDAEGLRIAFRRAAKSAPIPTPIRTIRTPRCVSGSSFARRQSSAMPSSAETYDQLLAIAMRPSEPPRRAVVYEKIHRFATNTMAATVIAAALIGGEHYSARWREAVGDPTAWRRPPKARRPNSPLPRGGAAGA